MRCLALIMLVATFAAAGQAGPARAACYEDVGCTDSDRFSSRELASLASCQVLWEMRNGIYAENGYCFETPRGIRAFGNDGCRYHNQSSVPMNAYERGNVGAIVKAERALGC
jgi:hypothetical protein